ncbi:MAG TPA: hypothetical protein ENK75_03075 [Saprospiraceae bacterium]|nr:hypothetical protein [Saprospiraceae bacterium]
MKLLYTLLLNFTLLNLTQSVLAQDYDVYKRTVDDKIKIPEIYKNMLLEEYQILSRDIRMMDMSYAMIVPGYVHFKARENTRAYEILATRLAGYAGLYTYYSRSKSKDKQVWEWITGKKDKVNVRDKALFISSWTLVLGSYFYDWIHGKYMLEKKQENIKYKYGIKFKMEESQAFNQNRLTPNISISVSF